MDQLTILFVIFLATIFSVPVGRRIAIPSPVLMTLFGVAMALLPQVPNPNLRPDLILPLVLPPLLFAAARRTHWRQFKASWRTVLLLAILLVLVTTAAVAGVFSLLNPTLPVGVAVLLGALISPPDPVAATAVAGDLSLPRRLINTLETEGLFNDVTAVVIYGVAVSAVVSRHFSGWEALGELALSGLIALAVGLGLGWFSNHAMSLLGDATLQVSLSLLVPYAAYVAADRLHGSGVLAVLVYGLYLSDKIDADDVAYRLVGTAFWDIIELLVTGFAFGLIGQEMYVVVNEVGGRWTALASKAFVVVAVVVVVRLAWLLPAAWLANRLGRARGTQAADDRPITRQETVVMWWAGMRGVVTVALALAIPLTVDGGAPFPGRDALLFTAFAVVLFTLVVQGLTLPLLVRSLNIGADDQALREAEKRLWYRVAKAELRRLNEAAEAGSIPDELYERLADRRRGRLVQSFPESVDEELRAAAKKRYREAARLRELDQEMIAAGRRELLDARAEPDMDPELVDRLLRRLDLRSERH
ncbi:Na+/H+ antiporter [Actinocrinis puniceicyclus]|uniref:Na+/H+ antiporter n=1 Tax=Actinocrinis puniceicyclus TaxID=977794 RepID=A0A8J8BAC1_9ACTN|nr:Na+/H+ antiporter [Actinocrinis puniceicyclus]MBS2961928.1 Na+/H+ antiporter [Actinocrinis puniceicyclus]